MKKLYIPMSDVRHAAPWRLAAASMGIEITHTPGQTPYVLPLWPASTRQVAAMPLVNFMSPESLAALGDRLVLAQSGVKILPSHIVASRADIESLTYPIFVRARNTELNPGPVLPFNHTTWGSSAELLAAMDDKFWVDVAQYIFSPALATPLPMHQMLFTVSPSGRVRLLFNLLTQHGGSKAKGSSITVDPPASVSEMAQNIADKFQIRGGFHNIECVEYEGEWVLIDMNPRPVHMLNEGVIAMHPGLYAPALAHIMDLPMPAEQPVFVGQRVYWDRNPSSEFKTLALSLGLLPRYNQEAKHQMGVVIGVGGSEQEVNEKFSMLEGNFI